MLPLNFSDTAATSHDGTSLEFIADIAGRQCYIQDASGRGLWELFYKHLCHNSLINEVIMLFRIFQPLCIPNR